MSARPTAVVVAVLLAGTASLAAQARVRSTATLPRLSQAGPPPVGPAPQGFNVASAGTYGAFAQLTWTAAPNAASFEVSRSLITDPACCNATSGPLPANATSWGDAGLFRPGSYLYTLAATYTDGSVGKSAFSLVVLSGVAPTPLKADDLGRGHVKITWNLNTLGANAIMITGPGVAGGYGVQGTKLVVGGGPIDLHLPAGTHTWKVATAYDNTKLPFPLATTSATSMAFGRTYVVPAPESEWATVSQTITIRSGRYRIAIERFKAIEPAAEDALRSDGRGNEIYILAQVNEYRRWGRQAGTGMVSSRLLRTPTFGDVQNYPNRIRAGSVSPTGGLQANDEYPAPVQLISQLQPPTTNNLPFLLWEGDLTEIDGAVVIAPSIWEADEDERLLPVFAAYQAATAANIQYLNDVQPFLPWNGSGGQSFWRPLKCPQVASGPRFFMLPAKGTGGDEPVDLQNRQGYCQAYAVINWSLAEAYTGTAANPAAEVEIPMDGTPPWGRYKVVLRIEKVTPAGAVVAPLRATRKSVP